MSRLLPATPAADARRLRRRADRLRQRLLGEHLVPERPRDARRSRGRRQPGRRLARSRGRPTPRRAPRSASSAAAGTTGLGRHASRGRAAARTAACCAPTRPGTGESFIPSHPFRAGEKVTVQRAGHGRPEHRHGRRTSFTIAHQYAPSARSSSRSTRATRAAVQHYVSAPSLTPSTVRITTPAKPGAAPGDLFLAPYQGKGTPGPMITDQDGNLIWFKPLPRRRVGDQLPGRPAVRAASRC